MKKLGVLSCSCMLAHMLLAAASNYTWTPTSALWLADPNWNDGSVWADGNTAIFSGNAPTDVSVSGDVNAYDVKVSGAGYSFSGGGTIVISNGYFDVASGATATVHCALSQPNATPAVANRFRKSGEGTLVLKGNGSFDRYIHLAGDMVVDGGTFTITSSLSGAGTDTEPFILANGGKFIVGGGGKVFVKGGYSMNCGVEVIVTNGLFDLTGLSNEFMSSYYPGIADNRVGTVIRGTRSVLTVQDMGIVSGGTFRVSQGGSNPGIVNLNPGGIMALTKFNNDNGNSVGAVNFNGGSFVRRKDVSGSLFSHSGTDADAKWGKVTVNIMEGGLHFTDGGKGTIFNRPLLNGTGGVDGGVHLTGLGDNMLELTCANTYTGGTTISNAGTVVISSDSSLGAVPSAPTVNFTFKGGSCYLASATGAGTVDVNANRLIEVAEDTSASFRAYTNSTLVLNSAFSALGGWINVLGNNTTLSGTVAFNPGAGATNLAQRLYSFGGVADFRSGVTHLTNIVKDTGTKASIYARGGGDSIGWSSNFVLRISGGEIVTDGGYASTYDYGQIEVTNAFLNIAKCAEVLNGHGRPGRISIFNGGVVDAPPFRISQCPYASSEIYLGTGGELRVPYLKIDTAMKTPYFGRVCFDGGKIVSKATSASFFGDGSDYYTNIHVRVMKGGAKFDTKGNVARIHKQLEGDENGSGGLVKYGEGHLLLHQSCTYTGATEVVEGTLRLSGPTNILWAGSTLILGTNAICEARTDYIGTQYLDGSWISCTQTLARVEGCGQLMYPDHVSVTNSVAPGLGAGGIGTLTFSKACSLKGTLEIDVGTDGADSLSVSSGSQNLADLTLDVGAAEDFQPPRGTRYTIVSAPDGISGKFAAVNAKSPHWMVDYKSDSVVLYYARGTTLFFK